MDKDVAHLNLNDRPARDRHSLIDVNPGESQDIQRRQKTAHDAKSIERGRSDEEPERSTWLIPPPACRSLRDPDSPGDRNPCGRSSTRLASWQPERDATPQTQ